MPLSYDAMNRIARNVILGLPPDPHESPEAAAWRQQVERDAAAAKQAGHALELPWDWEDNTPLASQPAHPAEHYARPTEHSPESEQALELGSKRSKVAANYRAGFSVVRCEHCSHFRTGGLCAIVEGAVRPEDVCDFFTQPAEHDRS